MFEQPQAEHAWLTRLVGDWTCESECQMGPDQPPSRDTGTAKITSMSGMWLLIEGEASGPDGAPFLSQLTLGYDPREQVYRGTFIASMMTYLWIYRGTRDESGNKLTLDTVGPKFDQPGLGKYQDIVEILSDDEWRLSSQIQGDGGTWIPFMTARYTRVAK